MISTNHNQNFIKGLFVDTEKRPALFWRIVIYMVFFLIAAILSQLAAFALKDTNEALISLVASLTLIVSIIAFTYLIRRFVDKRPWAGMGLPFSLRTEFKNLMIGFAIGAALILIVFAIEYFAGWVQIIGNEFTLSGLLPAIEMLLSGLIYFFAIGLMEELMFRGYILQNLGERYPIWIAVLVSGIFFGALHALSAKITLSFVISATLMTALLTLSRLKTGTIWVAIGGHTAWNWVQSTVLGLSEVGVADPDPSLFHLAQSGPASIVGVAPAIEGSLLFISVLFTITLAVIALSHRSNSKIQWREKLSPDGTVVSK